MTFVFPDGSLGFEVDFVEDALGEFVDGGAGVAAAVDGVAGNAGKDELRFSAVFVGDGDLHGGFGEILRYGRGRIVVDFVGLILAKLADKIGARRRLGFFVRRFIGGLLEDEAAAGAFDAGKGAIQVVDLGAGDVVGHDMDDLLIAQIEIFIAQNGVKIVVDLKNAGARKIARVIAGGFLFAYF